MNKFKAFVWSALALILLVSGGIADTLKIGHIAGRTGWLKGPALSATVAVDMAVKEINAAGGINGKMIEIIGTIGPSSIKTDVLIKLKAIGLNSFRINLSHSDTSLLDYYYQQFENADGVVTVTQSERLAVTHFMKESLSGFIPAEKIHFWD